MVHIVQISLRPATRKNSSIQPVDEAYEGAGTVFGQINDTFLSSLKGPSKPLRKKSINCGNYEQVVEGYLLSAITYILVGGKLFPVLAYIDLYHFVAQFPSPGHKCSF